MSEYYAVQRSGDSLAHYGVKGMKWGVQKRAVDSGRKSAGYHHAVRKLKLLQSQENRDIGKVQRAQAQGKIRKVSRMYRKAAKKLEQMNENANLDFHKGQYKQMKEDQSRMFWWSDNSKGLTGLGLKKNFLVRALNRHDGRQSKKLTTKRGHAKAVKKRNEYEQQMAKMFAGTEYGKQTKSAVMKRRRSAQHS